MKDAAPKYYLKLALVYILLFASSLSIGWILLEFTKSQKYLVPSMEIVVLYTFLMFTFLHVYSLTAGTWEQRIKYFLGPFCILMGIGLNIAILNVAHALVFVLLGWVYIAYYIWVSNSFRKILIKFVPSMIFRSAARSFVLLFSIVAGLMVFLNYSSSNIDSNLGSTVMEAFSPITSSGSISPFQKIITQQIDELSAPYKNFVPPIIGLIAFSIFQLLGLLAYFLFNITTDVFILITRKIGILHMEEVDVKQEVIRF